MEPTFGGLETVTRKKTSGWSEASRELRHTELDDGKGDEEKSEPALT